LRLVDTGHRGLEGNAAIRGGKLQFLPSAPSIFTWVYCHQRIIIIVIIIISYILYIFLPLTLIVE